MFVGIYQIRNKINNKIYIGSSINIKKRWNEHMSDLFNNTHHNIYLQRVWNKYGELNFVFEILLLCEQSELLKYEQWFLDNVIEYGVDYNISKFSDVGFRGGIHTDKWKERKSKEMTGENNPMFGKVGANRGKKFTEETKLLMSKARIGIKYSKETLNKISKSKIGSKNPSAKLIKERVLMIRRMYLTGKYTQEGLGKIFNIGNTQVWRIVNRNSWRNV